MRKILLIGVMVGAITAGVSGCSTVTSLLGGNSVASQAPGVTATTEKSLTIANLALAGLGNLLITSANTGVLHGADATTAKGYYDTADDALKTAKTFDDAANEQGVLSAIAKAQDAMVQAKALTGGK